MTFFPTIIVAIYAVMAPHGNPEKSPERSMYAEIAFGTNAKPDETVFAYAIAGYERLHAEGMLKKDLLTVIDFTKPSTEKRMWVIDLKEKRLLYHSLVAHGRNSGELYANSFSNNQNSHQSSLGFYVTRGTYTGKNGLSLKLQGMETGVNDKAEARAVVIHSAAYVSEQFIQKNGRLGRSYGCPAIPVEHHRELIETLSRGSCLFIYSNDPEYLSTSLLLNGRENQL